jgi:hypothetical protein
VQLALDFVWLAKIARSVGKFEVSNNIIEYEKQIDKKIKYWLYIDKF